MGQQVKRFINSVAVAASNLQYLGEDVSDQRVKFQILGNLLPEFEALVTTLTYAGDASRYDDLRRLREAILAHEKKLAAKNLLAASPAAPPAITPSIPSLTLLVYKLGYRILSSSKSYRFLGLIITRDRKNRRLYIDQIPYVHEILEEFNMGNCTLVSIAHGPERSVGGKEGRQVPTPAERKVYQRGIGKLMYLMLETRPDLAFKLAQFAAAPVERHWFGY